MRGGQAATTTANINPTTLIQPAMDYVNTLNTQTQRDLDNTIYIKYRNLPISQIKAWDNIINQLSTSPSTLPLQQHLAYNIIADRIMLGTPIPSAGTTTVAPTTTAARTTTATPTTTAARTTTATPTTTAAPTTTLSPTTVSTLASQAMAKIVAMTPTEVANLTTTANTRYTSATPEQMSQIITLTTQLSPLLPAISNKIILNIVFGIPM